MDAIKLARRNIRRIAGRLSAEGGFALPTVMLMLVAAFATVSVTVVYTVEVQGGTVRDERTKSAIQLAETGVNQALLQFNRVLVTTNPCSPVSSSPPDASGWCAPVTTTDINGGTYTYQAQAPVVAGAYKTMSVVGTGTLNGVTRRVQVSAKAVTGQQVFSDYGVKAQDSINMNSNAEIHTGTATNGDITMNSNAKQCGQASVGVGRHMTMQSNAGYFQNNNCTTPITTVNQQPLILPAVNQGDAVTNNDNSRFFALDTVSGPKNLVCWNRFLANGSGGGCVSRGLDLNSNSSVTLGGSRYSFCQLTMSSNANLYIQAGHNVTIYFDTPESCGLSSGVEQLRMNSNTRITSTDGGPTNVAMLFAGSPTRQTKIILNSNTSIGGSCEQNFVVYAPRSDVQMNSNSTFCGALAAKTLQIDSNARIYTDTAAGQYALPGAPPHYAVSQFVECNTTGGAAPNTNC
jgi:predicted acyltransferase (DUF342 family)